MRNVMVIAATVFLMVGCAAPPRYEQPSDPNAPTLTLKNISNNEVAVMGYSDPVECRKKVNISDDSSRYYMDVPNGESKKIRIRPNELFSIFVSMRIWGRDCFLVGSLLPAPSEDYVGVVSYESGVCALSVRRLEKGVEVMDSAFTPRKFKMAIFSDEESQCADRYTGKN